PGVASRKMEKAGVSTVYVLGEQRKFKGVVTIDDANRLKNENVKSLDDIIRNDAYKTLPDTPIKQLLSEAIGSTVPIAVIDSNDKFLGVVDRASIINEVKLNSSENGAVSNQQESENIEEINT
ncbi:MAG TPA: CBS domain-containing protein, partial [Bacteroidales bacterium]|nr:CBS domain-containing protein [Bacteroidales bacterium]